MVSKKETELPSTFPCEIKTCSYGVRNGRLSLTFPRPDFPLRAAERYLLNSLVQVTLSGDTLEEPVDLQAEVRGYRVTPATVSCSLRVPLADNPGSDLQELCGASVEIEFRSVAVAPPTRKSKSKSKD